MSQHSPVAKAITYVLGECGRICLTNDAAKHALRGIALGQTRAFQTPAALSAGTKSANPNFPVTPVREIMTRVPSMWPCVNVLRFTAVRSASWIRLCSSAREFGPWIIGNATAAVVSVT